MIEKMKFLSITGPKEDIDRVVDLYLCKYEIQMENALSELKTVKNLRPYTEPNPYRELFQKAGRLAANFESHDTTRLDVPSIEEAAQIITDVEQKINVFSQEREALLKKLDMVKASYEKILPFKELDYDISSILHFQHIRFRFGRIPKEYYAKFEAFVYDSLDTILYKCQEDEAYVSAVYFVPASISKRIDAIYSSLHFERYIVPDEYEGTPDEAVRRLEDELKTLREQIEKADRSIADILNNNQTAILASFRRLDSYNTNFSVKRLAACTNHETNTFYILCGWLSEKDAKAFQEELKGDEKTFCFVEDDHNNLLNGPPTKLKNPKLFKPFEMFLKMYGMPAYNEFDPTILIGITYAFLFGFMFGDAGQGLVLLFGGLFLYKARKMDLAAIISCCGFFSTIFGFLFGSFFGFENVFNALWLHPASHMTNLPFIGKLNTVFVVAIALGMGLIVLTMVLNILNSIRVHDPEKAWFDTNGLAGLAFYGGVLSTVLLFMTGKTVPAAAVLTVMFGIPLLIIFLKEPLTAMITKKAEFFPESKVMFFVQGFFEMFELLLSYFSNTLSFVRVGAFAVSHAAMMEVVLMLAGAEAGAAGSPNWGIVIIGNLFVCAMEGLIVGIQVLRLEYYEIFSRFYKGNGREFKPYIKSTN